MSPTPARGRTPDDMPGPEERPQYATAGQLFGVATDDRGEDLKLSSGLLVRVQPITRKANLELGKGDAPVPLMEARLLSAGLVEPRLSVDAALKFITDAGTRTVGEITDRIREISGMSVGADKSGVPGV